MTRPSHPRTCSASASWSEPTFRPMGAESSSRKRGSLPVRKKTTTRSSTATCISSRSPSGEVRRLTFNDSTNSAPAISPDGSSVAFMSTRTEKPQLWLLPLNGGEPRKLTDLAQGVGGGPVWSPDGSKIAFTAGPQEEPRKPERPYRIDRTVWRFDEIGVIDDAVQDVYVLDATDDAAEPRRLTDDRFINSQPKWSADGQSLVYVASHDPDSHQLMSRLRRVDLEGEVTDLTEPDGLVATHAPLSDGRVVYVLDFELDKVIGSRAPLYVLDPATGTRVRRGADIEGHIEGGIQGDNPGSRLGVGQLLLTDGDRDAVVRVQTGGEIALVKSRARRRRVSHGRGRRPAGLHPGRSERPETPLRRVRVHRAGRPLPRRPRHRRGAATHPAQRRRALGARVADRRPAELLERRRSAGRRLVPATGRSRDGPCRRSSTSTAVPTPAGGPTSTSTI